MEYTVEKIRLNKYLSEKGICSRREADRLTVEGRIFVNSEPAVLGQKVSAEDEIVVDGIPVSRKMVTPVLLAVNKPVGVVCTTAEFPGERNIVDLVSYPTRIYPVGRLDKDSEGLILMTNQGELVNEILRSAHEHEKEYVVTTAEQVTEESLRRMAEGVELPELGVTTQPCRVRKSGNREFHIVLKQGLNRQIRRMCEAVGLHVLSLKRIRIMNIWLGNLPLGKFRHVTPAEYRQMQKLFEM